MRHQGLWVPGDYGRKDGKAAQQQERQQHRERARAKPRAAGPLAPEEQPPAKRARLFGSAVASVPSCGRSRSAWPSSPGELRELREMEVALKLSSFCAEDIGLRFALMNSSSKFCGGTCQRHYVLTIGHG